MQIISSLAVTPLNGREKLFNLNNNFTKTERFNPSCSMIASCTFSLILVTLVKFANSQIVSWTSPVHSEKFYVTCANNIPQVHICDGGEVYSESEDKCLPEETAPFSTLRSAENFNSTKSLKQTADVSGKIKNHRQRQVPEAQLHSTRYRSDNRQLFCTNIYRSCLNEIKNPCPDTHVYVPQTGNCVPLENIAKCATVEHHSTTAPTQAQSNEVPFDCKQQHDGLYPDPTNPHCSSTFYICINGTTQRSSCANNQIYLPKLFSCQDRQEIQACTGETTTTTAATTTTPATTTPATTETTTTTTASPLLEINSFDCKSKANGLYADPHNACSSIYYACFNKHSFKAYCPNGLFFNVKILACDKQENVQNCLVGKPTPQPTESTLIGDHNCAGMPNGRYPLFVDTCSPFFYVCKNGHQYIQQCTAGLFFNSQYRRCFTRNTIPACRGGISNPFQQITEQQHITSESTTPSTKPSHVTDRPTTPFTAVQKPISLPANFTEQFYKYLELQKLVTADHSYPEKESDLKAASANTPSATSVTDDYLNLKITTTQHPRLETTSNANHPKQPSMGSNAGTSSSTSGGFQEKITQPDKQINLVTAGQKSLTTPSAETFNQPDKTVPVNCANLADGFYADPTNPYGKEYYHCSNRQVYLKRCPENEHFNYTLGRCDSTVGQLGNASVILDQRCADKEDGNYPIGLCERSFYSCSGHAISTQQCPANLFYDDEKKLCDVKANIPSCGGKRPPNYTTNILQCSPDEEGKTFATAPCSSVYYICSKGVLQKDSCYGDLVYNERLAACGSKIGFPECTK
ncbi:Chondroitin proteoglycan-2 [Trichinella pseudospiralis]|uniref:Chondroitin proteoglycan-2 n=1 Tax=Trichinella pseudospiralis TaxID=6337 RepID=A0A0V0YDT4_TRIPS|nr:Chondroitin proteoglycan-2 [Trichinella pseudospiralis]